MPQAPFYSDWTFWAFVASAIAIVLSQVPPIKSWFRGPKLLVETPAQVRLAHVAGYSSMGIVLGLRNVGGRSVRVTALKFRLTRDKRDALEIPITEFYPNPTGNQTLLLVPFTLAPGAETTRSYNAYLDLSREANRQLTQLASNVRRDIGAKVTAKKAQGKPEEELVQLDEKILAEAHALYKANFWWKAGEYEVDIVVTTEEPCDVRQPKRSFTIWESDEAELRALIDDYKYGFGIGVPHEKHAGIIVKVRVD